MRLGVNIDHVATLRQQRRGTFPDPVEAALIAQDHGADSIVAHLREDRRHIQDQDIRQLRQRVRIPLALEMAATSEMEKVALDLGPARVCLVPEKRQELTTEGGLDVVSRRDILQKMIERLKTKKIGVSLFIDADEAQIRCAHAVGAPMIELHTGHYAEAAAAEKTTELLRFRQAAALCRQLGLRLHAGHGLDEQNVAPVAQLPGMEELNIGFSIVGRALFIGLGEAVRRMKQCIETVS